MITHFTHIPWPEPRYWELLPAEMREAIFRGLCGADIVGFQTQRDARNFVDGCLMFLEGARVDREEVGVIFHQHLARVRVYPISVCPDSLYHRTNTPLVRDYVDKLQSIRGEKTIVRVDRLEPSKNIIRGLHAFDRLLTDYPEYVGNLKMLLFLVPSRESIPEYQAYRSETLQTVERILAKHSQEEYRPIELFLENNYDQALAGMTLYDVLFVNPLIDGMNLVAKEGPIVNASNGVLVLSEGAGAFQQLREGVIPVAAADVEGTKLALRLALEMPEPQKRVLAATLRASIEKNDLFHWFTSQLMDVATIMNVGDNLTESAKSA
jgi:trehalose 6-phosphate synthase